MAIPSHVVASGCPLHSLHIDRGPRVRPRARHPPRNRRKVGHRPLSHPLRPRRSTKSKGTSALVHPRSCSPPPELATMAAVVSHHGWRSSRPQRVSLHLIHPFSLAYSIPHSTYSSSAPTPIVPAMKTYFGFSDEVATLTISLFVAGYCVGPILWAPLSEQFGRRPIFIWTFLVYVVRLLPHHSTHFD